jgi:glycosyltransferase involved in cell wall biosynthesis
MGGLEKLLVEFARHADRERFTLHFISLSDRGVLADDIEAAGWPVHTLNQAEGFRPTLVFRLARLLRKLGIHVAHSHDERPHIYTALASIPGGVRRLIHTRHRGQNLEVSRRQAWLMRSAVRLTNHYVCVSEDSARLAVAQGVPRHKVSVIWNGIDLERFAVLDRNPQRPPGSPAAVVARMSPVKSIDSLIRAAALVVAEEPSFRLEVAGDGPCLPDLKHLSESLGLTAHVRFLGQVRDVPGLLTRAGLFVLPSLSEGVSLTLLEAMAMSLPIVTTRVGGNPEVVVDGQTGLLVPPADPAALAGALLRLWRNPGERRRFGEAGRRRVEEHFEVRKMVARYERLYLS